MAEKRIPPTRTAAPGQGNAERDMAGSTRHDALAEVLRNVPSNLEQWAITSQTTLGLIDRNLDALLDAVAAKDLAKIKALRAEAVDVHADSDAAFFAACKDGWLSGIKYFHKICGVDINQEQSKAIVLAAVGNHVPVLSYFKRNGGNMLAGDHEALAAAAKNGAFAAVRYLCEECGARATACYSRALRLAAKLEDIESFVYLHRVQGGNITELNNEATRTALATKNIALISYIQSCGVKIEESEQEYDSIKPALMGFRKWRHAQPGIDVRGVESMFHDSVHLPVYTRVQEYLREENLKSASANKIAWHVARLFSTRAQVDSYVDAWADHDGASRTPVYDLLSDIRTPPPASVQKLPRQPRYEFGAALLVDATLPVEPDWQAWREGILAHGPALARVLRFSDFIVRPVQAAGAKGSDAVDINATWRAAYKVAYRSATEHPDLAAACFNRGLNQEAFDQARMLYRDFQKNAAAIPVDRPSTRTQRLIQDFRFRFPAIQLDGAAFDIPGVVFRKLPPEDLRCFFIGETANAPHRLDHPRGAAVVKHVYKTGLSNFYAVTDKTSDQILGYSWAWRGEDGSLTFENGVSMPGGSRAMTPSRWKKLFIALPAALRNCTDMDGIHDVRIGKSTSMPDLTNHYDVAVQASRPFLYGNQHRDAEQQYVAMSFAPQPG